MSRTDELGVAAVLGAPAGVSFALTGVDQAMNMAWHNTGNFLFQFGIMQSIANPMIHFPLATDTRRFNDLADVLVIPAANLVNPDWDLADWAEIIERCDLPVFIAGLGAQGLRGASPRSLKLQPGTDRFLRLVAERAPLIGVRGAWTADVLDALGIHNVKITGCPSMTLNCAQTGASIAAYIANLPSIKQPKVAYLVGLLDSAFYEIEARLMAFAMHHNAPAIVQTHNEFFRVVCGEDIPSNESQRMQGNITGLASSAHGLFDSGRCADYLLGNMHFYSDAHSWIDGMGRYDLSIGMRIHGAIAAILGGGLGVCVTHDARTHELASTMEIPWIDAADLSEALSCARLQHIISFDAARFDKARQHLTAAYQEVLKSSGLTLRRPEMLS